MYLPPPTIRFDKRGQPYCPSGLVRGECEQHWFPDWGADTVGMRPGHWEGEPGRGDPDPPGYPRTPTNRPPAPPPMSMRGLSGCAPCVLAGVDVRPAPVRGWDDSECSLPTLGGFLVFGTIGAVFSRRGRRLTGAMDGVFGSWLGCAAARALRLGDTGSVTLSVMGALISARLYDGR